MKTPAAIPKPLLRGYFHAAMVPLAVAATAWLALSSRDTPAKLVSMLVYGSAMVILFAFSGVYHIGTWGPRAREVLRRLDHSNIYLLIAGTYTPVAVSILEGFERAAVLAGVWVPAVAGIVVVGTGLRTARWVSALLYVLVGWVALAFLPALIHHFTPAALVLVLCGGACYTAGAVCYATRRPRLWPRVFGYHEVFHLLVIAGTAVLFAFILRYVVPATPA